jgi:hypothetical protein
MSNKIAFLVATSLIVAGFFLSSQMNTSTDLEFEFGHNYVMEFNNWKALYGRSYTSAQEELYRLKVFIENQIWIKENQGEEYTLEINQFGDLTKEEFRAMYLGYKYVVKDVRPRE